MRLAAIAVTLASMAVLWGQVWAVAGSATPFDGALSSAQGNVATDEGKAFDGEIGTQFGGRHANTMARCTEGVDGPNLAPFDLLMKIGGDGKVQEVLVRPDTRVAVCLRKAVAKDIYKKPPRPGYWVRIGMSVTP